MNMPAGKTLIRMGGAAAAVVSIITVLGYARPYMQSDDPPLAGKAAVNNLDLQFAQYTKQDQFRWTQQQMQSQFFMREVMSQDYRYWTTQYELATTTLQHHPNDPAALALRDNAAGQLRQLAPQLGMSGKAP